MGDQLKHYEGSQSNPNYVLHLYKSGNDIQSIADHMDWSYWTILKIIQEAGL